MRKRPRPSYRKKPGRISSYRLVSVAWTRTDHLLWRCSCAPVNCAWLTSSVLRYCQAWLCHPQSALYSNVEQSRYDTLFYLLRNPLEKEVSYLPTSSISCKQVVNLLAGSIFYIFLKFLSLLQLSPFSALSNFLLLVLGEEVRALLRERNITQENLAQERARYHLLLDQTQVGLGLECPVVVYSIPLLSPLPPHPRQVEKVSYRKVVCGGNVLTGAHATNDSLESNDESLLSSCDQLQGERESE